MLDRGVVTEGLTRSRNRRKGPGRGVLPQFEAPHCCLNINESYKVLASRRSSGDDRGQIRDTPSASEPGSTSSGSQPLAHKSPLIDSQWEIGPAHWRVPL